MKSLLVDALRQAQGEMPDDDPGRQHAAERADQQMDAADTQGLTGDDARIESGDLNLLETGTRQVGGSGAAAESRATHRPAAETLSAEQAEPELAPDPDAPLLNATMILDTRGATLFEREPVIMKIGRLAPLLCLIAMSVTVAAYLLFNRLSMLQLNEDLAGLAGRVRLDTGATADQWQDLPLSDINVFDRVAIGSDGNKSSAAVKLVRVAAEMPTAKVAIPLQTQRAVSRPDAGVLIEKSGAAAGDSSGRAYAHVVDAYAAYRAQDYRQAEQQYETALDIEPNHRDALAGLAAVYRQSGRNEQAVQVYEKLLAIDPGNTAAAAAILSVRSASAGWDSESDLKLMLQRFPDAQHLHFALGTVYVVKNRWPEARHEFLAAHRLDRSNADYSYNLAVSLEKLGEYRAARTYYETALATAGDDSNVDPDAISAHLHELATQLREPT